MTNNASRGMSVGSRRVSRKGQLPPARHGRPSARAGFPIAVAGASAGGLEAFRRLLSALPARSGVAFILVPHLDPSRESRMVELLAAVSAMPVVTAINGRRIRPDHVYVIPPNRLLTLRGGRLILTLLPDPHASHTTLDAALRSLAEDQGRNAVGIVLSGTGSHGAVGLQAVLEAGGLALAQDPITAQYGQMPRSAAAAGVPPRQVLAPEGMAAVLLAHARHIADRAGRPGSAPRRSTPVFQDAKALDALTVHALPALIARATPSLPVHAWIPECGTGEEAYSVAILLFERLEAAGKGGALKVLATDSDPESLGHARRGVYPASMGDTISRERLARFALRTANEELQSSSEEMRSMYEELESSKANLQERTEAAELAEEQLRAVLDATADAVVTINTEGKIVTFNGSASRMFGYALHEVIGRNVSMLLPPELRAHHDEYLARYRKTHQRHVIGTSREVVAYRRDGTRFPALLSLAEAGEADLVVGCLRDLSEGRALQEEVLHIAALEQQRIGQELHDGMQQELTGLGLLAQSLSDELREGGSSAAEAARRLAAGIAETNRHVRSVARGLVPVPVGVRNLPALLGELARSTQESYKLSCRLDCPASLEMPNAATATHLYRIAQEAVGNAVKHAKADHVLIRLAVNQNQLRLEVHDNGVGIPAQPAVSGGVGLRLMEHRCAAIGGQFRIEPREGGGTVVACTVPFPGRS